MATIINRPNGISLFQLLALKGAIGLEAKGLRHSSGPLRPRWAAILGLKPRDKHEKYIAAIEAKIEALKAAGDLGISSTD